jgi:hypothetical protein
VVAQDRWLVMDPATPIEDSAHEVTELGHAAAIQADREPVEVLLRWGSKPLRLWTVIHDLNRLPTCRKQWIATTLLNTLRELSQRDIETVSMPCLGCSQGVIDAGQFLNLLVRAIHMAPIVHRLRLTLNCERIDHDALCSVLQTIEF